MLTDEEFITQSVTLNLFYLSNIKGYSLNITLSFLDEYCNKRAKQFVIESEEILNSFIDRVEGLIPAFAFESNFLVTEYTYDCERLTEKLFDIDLDTAITEKLVSYKSSKQRKYTDEDINLMTDVNKKTYDLATRYIEFLKEIFIQQKNNEFFSYNSLFSIKTVIDIVELHKVILNRLIKKMEPNPTSVVDYEYKVINFLNNVATIVSGSVDPSREDIYTKANSFAVEFKHLNRIYSNVSNPDELNVLINKTKKLVKRFSLFFKNIIEDVLNEKAYLIIEASFLDDAYRIINYVTYVLSFF